MFPKKPVNHLSIAAEHQPAVAYVLAVFIQNSFKLGLSIALLVFEQKTGIATEVITSFIPP